MAGVSLSREPATCMTPKSDICPLRQPTYEVLVEQLFQKPHQLLQVAALGALEQQAMPEPNASLFKTEKKNPTSNAEHVHSANQT